MKFDIVLANPPYSDRDHLLYPLFFKLSLSLANTVVMIMPTNLTSRASRLKAHNHLVKQHMTFISNNVTNQFNVGIPDIRYVIASKSNINQVVQLPDQLESYQPILPERARLTTRRGNNQFSRIHNQTDNGVAVMNCIHRGNKIQWRTIKSEIANTVKQSMITTAEWLVLVSENPSSNLFNVAVIKNTGVPWGSGIFAIDCDSEEAANKLANWLTGPVIQAEVHKLLSLKNTYTVSGAMMEKLPNYE